MTERINVYVYKEERDKEGISTKNEGEKIVGEENRGREDTRKDLG